MKRTLKILGAAVVWLAITAASYAQNQDSDSQTLRAILAELRAMHEDIRVTETTQFLLAELQLQQEVVNRATQSLDHAQEKLTEIHLSQQQIAADLDRTQNAVDKAASMDEKNALSQRIEELKSNGDQLKSAERDANVNLQGMKQRLQEAQDKLSGIDDQLSTAINRLAPSSK